MDLSGNTARRADRRGTPGHFVGDQCINFSTFNTKVEIRCYGGGRLSRGGIAVWPPRNVVALTIMAEFPRVDGLKRSSKCRYREARVGNRSPGSSREEGGVG